MKKFLCRQLLFTSLISNNFLLPLQNKLYLITISCDWITVPPGNGTTSPTNIARQPANHCTKTLPFTAYYVFHTFIDIAVTSDHTWQRSTYIWKVNAKLVSSCRSIRIFISRTNTWIDKKKGLQYDCCSTIEISSIFCVIRDQIKILFLIVCVWFLFSLSWLRSNWFLFERRFAHWAQIHFEFVDCTVLPFYCINSLHYVWSTITSLFSKYVARFFY